MVSTTGTFPTGPVGELQAWPAVAPMVAGIAMPWTAEVAAHAIKRDRPISVPPPSFVADRPVNLPAPSSVSDHREALLAATGFNLATLTADSASLASRAAEVKKPFAWIGCFELLVLSILVCREVRLYYAGGQSCLLFHTVSERIRETCRKVVDFNRFVPRAMPELWIVPSGTSFSLLDPTLHTLVHWMPAFPLTEQQRTFSEIEIEDYLWATGEQVVKIKTKKFDADAAHLRNLMSEVDFAALRQDHCESLLSNQVAFVQSAKVTRGSYHIRAWLIDFFSQGPPLR